MSDEEKCGSCQCSRSRHADKGKCECGCYGFFPLGAKWCENPACDGSGCKYNRADASGSGLRVGQGVWNKNPNLSPPYQE